MGSWGVKKKKSGVAVLQADLFAARGILSEQSSASLYRMPKNVPVRLDWKYPNHSSFFSLFASFSVSFFF